MKTVAIIGGGYSGTLTAIQLLKKSETIAVKLINCNYPIAQGIAYSTGNYEHLLNVPAAKMSAFTNEPTHFINWLQTFEQPYSTVEFVPRSIYGKYLSAILKNYSSNVQLELIDATATNIIETEQGYEIQFNNHEGIFATDVVLATGNFMPAPPKLKNAAFLKSDFYFKNPWNDLFLKDIALQKNILLIGSGLTMIDCVLSLQSIGFKGKIIAVSPRGYIPKSHHHTAPYPDFYSELKGLRLAEIIHTVRKHLKFATVKESSWHAVIDSLRPHIQKIWLSFSAKEKQQFISHVRHIWGVARHRLPPYIHATISALINNEQLEIIGARIVDLEEENNAIVATLKLRANAIEKKIHISRVVNCTGPQSNYLALEDELITNLIASKMIVADELKMGIKATKEGEIISEKSKKMYAIGSLLRGVLWETTAVPELRIQANNIATEIITNSEND
jgi:uncharacterized NAD(P)/FAD-binding protein YdhS